MMLLNWEITNKYYKPNQIDLVLNSITGYEITRDAKKIEYYEIPCSFDTETSSFYVNSNQLDEPDKVAIMYEWTLCINGICIIGRTWEEFIYVYNKLVEFFNLNEERRLVIYVHNLSYEFQFMRKRFDWEDVFSLEKRKPIKAVTFEGIEFRCSMLLSGYGLAKLGEQLTKYKVKKLEGDLDYSLIRNSKTPLTEKEIQYCINDCLVVVAYIKELMERLGSITKIPMTKTGFVRKYCRDNCLYDGSHTKNGDKFNKYRTLMKSLTIDKDTFEQCLRAFCGGFTHANAYWVNETVNNVGSFDFTSSYPSAMISEQFPMSKAKKITITSKEEFENNIKLYCCLFDCEFTNIESKVKFENYISVSHCWSLYNRLENNGRIVSADKLCITLTDVDFNIIRRLYRWKNLKITNFKRFKRGYLPTDFIKAILQLYKDKTELKDVIGKEAEYLNSKEQVNSAYGMCVTNPCRDIINYTSEWESEEPDIETKLSEYNRSIKRFLYYPWGIWVTAYARLNLFTGILEFKDDYVYSDTDSIKCKNIENHMKYIQKYNDFIDFKLKKAMEYHKLPFELTRPKNKDGEEKPLGQWEYEGQYSRFKTIGAKRYMIEKNNKINITVSGVNKKYAVPYLVKEYKDKVFDKFCDGLQIPPEYTGKKIHTYIDDEKFGYVVDYLGNECYYDELSAVHLEATGYSMSLSEQYAKYLLGITEGVIKE